MTSWFSERGSPMDWFDSESSFCISVSMTLQGLFSEWAALVAGVSEWDRRVTNLARCRLHAPAWGQEASALLLSCLCTILAYVWSMKPKIKLTMMFFRCFRVQEARDVVVVVSCDFPSAEDWVKTLAKNVQSKKILERSFVSLWNHILFKHQKMSPHRKILFKQHQWRWTCK